METRRAYFRNMRSKCRCSYVLQFTWHLGVSSVLHRPLSQIIHCIVLYLDFQTVRSECLSFRLTMRQLRQPCKGRSQLGLRAQRRFKPMRKKHIRTQSPSHSQPADWQTYQTATEELCYQHIRQDALLEQRRHFAVSSQSRGVKVYLSTRPKR